MKRQIVVVHGGHVSTPAENILDYLKNKNVTADDFKLRKGWKEWLNEVLGNEFEMFYPQMQNKLTSEYLEWKTWFEKLFPFLNDGVILVGHSLGAIFLVKYLSENDFPKKIRALFLVAAPFDNDEGKTMGSFTLGRDFSKLTNQVPEIFLYHSKDDPTVPFFDFEKYKEKLPQAKFFSFEDRGHFNTETFEELASQILAL